MVVGRGGCGLRVEGRGLWVRVRGGRGGYENTRNCYFKMGCGVNNRVMLISINHSAL